MKQINEENGKIVAKTDDTQVVVKPIPGTNLLRVSVTQGGETTVTTFMTGIKNNVYAEGVISNEPFDLDDPTHLVRNLETLEVVRRGTLRECQIAADNVLAETVIEPLEQS